MTNQTTWTAFQGTELFAMGLFSEVAAAVKRAPAGTMVLVFDDKTGRAMDVDMRDVDLRGAAPAEHVAPLPIPSEDVSDGPRGRGRPKLGVVAREVTLLPRHWDWLATQPGGASIALRKLVEAARRTSGDKDKVRAAQDAAYHVMSALAGNLAGFEEATRALFAYDRRRFCDLIAAWPEDVRDYVVRLAFADLEPAG